MRGAVPRALAVAVLAAGLVTGSVAAPPSVTVAPTANVVGSVQYGPDVASWQHPRGKAISWSKVKKSGNSFAIVKATEGSTYTNPYYAKDVAGAQKAGLVVGSYHYARPTSSTTSAVSQARHFARVVADLRRPGTMPPILDLEQTGGLGPGQLVTWAQTFSQELRTLTGRTPVIYTYVSFWSSRMAATPAFSRHALWLAYYRAAPPTIGGWPGYTLWQYTDKAKVPGIAGRVDRSRFVGSVDDLDTFADGTVSTDWPVTAPSASSRVRATARVRSATVTWVPGDTGGSLPTSYTVTTSPGDASVIVPGTSTTATLPGLVTGTAYTFTVTATNVAGASAPSGPSTPVVARGDVPTVPTGLAASTGPDQVTLSWSPATRLPTAYRVFRCGSATTTTCTVNAAPIATVEGGTTSSFVDTAVRGGMHYRYQVSAINEWGTSARTPPVRVTPPVTSLDAPMVSVLSGASRLTVSWGAVLGAQRYEVLRCSGTGCTPSGAPVSTVPAPARSFTDRAAPGTALTYAVRAVTGAVVSAMSVPTSGTAGAAPPAVAASLNHATVERRTRVTLSGRVGPAYAGERVVRQYWTGRSWRTVASAGTDGSGRFRFTIRPTSRSRTTYRVVLPATATHMVGVSRSLRLRAT